MEVERGEVNGLVRGDLRGVGKKGGGSVNCVKKGVQ